MASPARHGPQSKKRRVFIIDDHAVLREGLASVINRDSELIVCGEAEGDLKALHELAISRPDVVLLDVSLRAADGIELLKMIRSKAQHLPILVYSLNGEATLAERAVRCGASGFIAKEAPPEKVIHAIKRVLGGELYFGGQSTSQCTESRTRGSSSPNDSPLEDLSEREREVFRLIGEGHGTKQIAELLHISAKTVESYQAHIKEKLSLRNARELIQRAVEWALSRKQP